MLAMMLSYPIHLHFLGHELYGVWLVLGTVLVFTHIGNLGVTAAITKFIAAEWARKNVSAIEQYLFNATVMLLCTGTVALLAILLFRTSIVALFQLTGAHMRVAHQLLPYIGGLTIYCLFTQVLNAALVGLGRQDITNYVQAVARVVTLVTATIMYSFGRSIESLLLGYCLSYVCIHLVSLVCIRRIAPIRFMKLRYLDWKCMKEILNFGSKVLGSQLLQMLISPFNKLMLSRHNGVGAIPAYEIAYGAVMVTGCFIETGFRALMPEISGLNTTRTLEARARITAITRKAVRIIFAFALPGYIILFIAAPTLFQVWLREGYNEHIPYAFRVMLVGGFLVLWAQPANNLLMGAGKVTHCLLGQLIQAAGNIALIVVVVRVTPSSVSRYVPFAVAVGMIMSATYLLTSKRVLFPTDKRG
ncbi:hypothetical protein LCGC14_0838680 [marine sediment metagenome]|uniref:Polysaccharide biosynthesis protein C-terminal domain-containing protein n=1 Tax=marine sediment metagenome TaxID=412755 RepID=A0A0F9PIG7_9ZZZZ